MSTNNETIGQSLEKSLCDIFNVDCNIESHRYDDNIVEKLSASGKLQKLLEKECIVITSHLGKDNGPTDFEVESEGKTKTLSAKTLKKKEGKICPQGGQLTYNSFDKKNNLVNKTEKFGKS